MIVKHPYFKYGMAVIMAENNFDAEEEVFKNITVLSKEIQKGLNHFRMKPSGSFKGMEKVRFNYVNEKKGNPDIGIFLSPCIVSTDKAAGNIYKACENIRKQVIKEPFKNINATMSMIPITGEYLSFGNTGTAGRGKPKIKLAEAALALITSTTPLKPCLAYSKKSKGKVERNNVAIIPDLEIKELVDFIYIFKRILLSGDKYNFNEGKVYRDLKPNGEIKSEKPSRPHIYNGNFPFAPRSSAMGKVALLGAIGYWSKEANFNEEGRKVLESLKDTQMYMVSYGNAETFKYNNLIIDLAIENQLREIIDSFYFAQLYSKGRRNSSNQLDYQNYDLFIGRFLQFFNPPSFKDFLSFRAEYPKSIQLLFKTYFEKMENIPKEVVASAKELGSWLNYAAYTAAKKDTEQFLDKYPKNTDGYWKQIGKMKSKFLVEMESSAFSARSGDALSMQLVRRAGLLSNSDAPQEGSLFMEVASSGELSLDKARNLIIAFSRIKNIKTKTVSISENPEPESTEASADFTDD